MMLLQENLKHIATFHIVVADNSEFSKKASTRRHAMLAFIMTEKMKQQSVPDKG